MFSSNTSQVSNDANYIEDVFSTYLYTGNDSTQTITNGIDLSTKGGMVWSKSRSTADPAGIFDTARGATNSLRPSGTNANLALSGVTSFNATGFTLGNYPYFNGSGQSQVAWTFREQPKFFDVVTFTTGATNTNQRISHSLGSVPGCIIVKRTDGVDNWFVWHRSLASTTDSYLYLNTTAVSQNTGGAWGATGPTATDFGIDDNFFGGGRACVAYIFAHNAGGFGLTGTDNVISCGSFTTNGSAVSGQIDLGYEPQWLLIKCSSAAGNWMLVDNMRGVTATGNGATGLYANTTAAEDPSRSVNINATGFSVSGDFGISATSIYIAIRRGPMKVPTSGTSVFSPVAYTGTNVDNRLVDTGIVTDMTMARIRTATSGGGFYTADRLRGNYYLSTATTGAQATDPDTFMTPTVGYGNSFSAMNGFGVGNDVNAQLNQSSTDQLAYAFRRSPNFFDEVFYTGTGTSGQTFNHNLGAVPDLMIVKFTGISTTGWMVYVSALTNASTSYLVLNSTNTVVTGNTNVWNSTAPTSSVFTLGANSNVNFTGDKYVAYLFASCPNVSKVGSYTGTGATLNIDCGFTSGARFVLIKRTDSSASWLVWDTARGMVAGTDPSLALNSTSIESNANSVYTTSGGFQIVSTSTAINASGGTYIYLAIA